MKLLRDAWNSLDNKGRMVLIGAVTALLIAAMASGLDLSWVPALLAGQ